MTSKPRETSVRKSPDLMLQDYEKLFDAFLQADPQRRAIMQEASYSKAFEAEVLCRVISMRRDIEYALGFLEPDDFSELIHRRIWWAVRRVLEEGTVPLDEMSPLVICDLLNENKLLDLVGGAETVEGLLTQAPNPETTILTVCNTLREKRARRRLLGEAYRLLMKKEKDVTSISEGDMALQLVTLTGQFQQTVSLLARASQTVGEEVGLSQEDVMRYVRIDESLRVNLPFESLADRMAPGLLRGTVLVLGARPGMGKTSAALHFFDAAATRGRMAIFASYEMSKRQLMRRMIAQKCGISMNSIDQMEDSELPEFDAIAVFLAKRVVWLGPEDLPAKTVEELNQHVTQWRMRGADVALVVADHLQLMRSKKDFRNNRVLEVGEICSGLVGLAQTQNVAILALSQLSRPQKLAGKNAIPPRPTMADLRESGSIEQDATQIVMLHRPEYYIRDGEVPVPLRGLAEFIVEKNRDGSPGIARLRWRGPYVSFSEMRADERIISENYDSPGEPDIVRQTL